jgi:ribosomal protein S18 acetylase RimI-like enzyme
MIRSIILCLLLLDPINAFVSPLNSQRRAVPSHLNLFDGAASPTVLEETAEKRKPIYPRGIQSEVIEKLENGASLPFEFVYVDSAFSTTSRTIRVKQLEKEDVNAAVGLCLTEYGSYPSSTPESDDPMQQMIQSTFDDFDNFMFSFVVLLGLGQRVERREKSDSNPSHPQDHNVICISEIDSNQNENIFGMAEVSLQPPDPARTSPPFVIPTNLKKLFAIFYGAPDATPYISNVLVTNEFRGKGYSKVLMAACEGLAKSWGYDEAYLHVDADSRSGSPAQGLYRSLGYMPVIDEKYNQNFTWMGIDSCNRGLYIVDGVALLFLKKILKN